MFQIMLACMIYIGYYCNSKCLYIKFILTFPLFIIFEHRLDKLNLLIAKIIRAEYEMVFLYF